MIDLKAIRCHQEYKFCLANIHKNDYIKVSNNMMNTNNLNNIIFPRELIYNTALPMGSTIARKLFFETKADIKMDDADILPTTFNPYKGEIVWVFDKYDKDFLNLYLDWLYNAKSFKDSEFEDSINSYKRILFNYKDEKNKRFMTMVVQVSNDCYKIKNGIWRSSKTYIHHEINKTLKNFINQIDDTSYYSFMQPTDKIKLETDIVDMFNNDLKIHLFKQKLNVEEVKLFVNYCTNNLLEPMIDNFGGNL